MRLVCAVWRWLTDWRNGVTAVVTVLIALLVVLVVDTIHARDEAMRTLDHAQRQVRLAEQLHQDNARLQRELRRQAADLAGLREQLRAAGIAPTTHRP